MSADSNYIAVAAEIVSRLPEMVNDSPINAACVIENMLRSVPARKCQWRYNNDYDYYETDCSNAFCTGEMLIPNQSYKFCPGCGGVIELCQ